MIVNGKMRILVALVACSAAGSAYSALVSDAAKIGANAGAMAYCKDNIASEDDKGKYNLVAIKALKEFDDLNSGDKVKALVFRKAAEDGDYLGDPLTENRCDSIRKLLFLK